MKFPCAFLAWAVILLSALPPTAAADDPKDGPTLSERVHRVLEERGGALRRDVADIVADGLAQAPPGVLPGTGAASHRRRVGAFFGFHIRELLPDECAARDLDQARAVLLDAVPAGSEAAELGLRTGDIVTDINGEPVKNGDLFVQALYGGPKGVLLGVNRGAENRDIRVSVKKLDRRPQIGDRAPDFRLATREGNRSLHLNELVGKRPVVLVFGSYT